MSLLASIRLLIVFLYAILPYFCFYLAGPFGEEATRGLTRQVFIGTVAATATFCVIAPLTTLFSLDLYIGTHAVLSLAGLALLAWRLRTHTVSRTRLTPSINVAVLALVAGAFAVRLAPMLWAGHSLGGDDARFHNILAEKILTERSTAVTWAPFAQVPVLYPQACHVFVAFLSLLSDRPVHECFNILFPIAGALTVGLIYLISAAVFNNRRSALWSAAVYAFLPFWGSLDYYRWGGLPNAMAMMFLCFVVLIILTSLGANARQRQIRLLGAVFCIVAIQMTHHYTLIAAFIFLGFGLLFSSDAAIRRTLLTLIVSSLAFCVPLLVAPRLASGTSAASTGLLVFRETPLTLLDCVWSLNPVLVVVFTVGVFAARKRTWSASQLLILAWFSGLLTAFVVLEYLYRGASLLLSGLHDCYTALTPSRMAADLAYPMSILCGLIPLSSAYEPRRRMALSLLALAAFTACAVTWKEQSRTGVYPEYEEAGQWLHVHSPSNSMVIGGFPHLEYLSWRETSTPPLPSSEPRNDPSVVWKKGELSLHDWLFWGQISRRPLYFVAPSGSPHSPALRDVFQNSRVHIMIPEWNTNHDPQPRHS